jgi:glucose uptake protein GlcU
MASAFVWGLVAALVAILCFGSFAVPLRTKRVREARVDAAALQIYLSLGVLLSTLLVPLFEIFALGRRSPVHFAYQGVLSALIWTPASLMSVVALELVGMSIGVALWSGATVVAGFALGAAIFRDPMRSMPLAFVAIALLVLGFSVVAFSGSETLRARTRRRRRDYTPVEDESSLVIDGQADEKSPSHSIQDDKISGNEGDTGDPGAMSHGSLLWGILCAIYVGLSFGSTMAPLRAMSAPGEVGVADFSLGFGVGTAVISPIVCAMFVLVRSWFTRARRRKPAPARHCGGRFVAFMMPRQAALPALCGGFVLGLGNVCIMYAVDLLGMVLGVPLSNISMVVSGLWGILLYREIRGLEIFVWGCGVAVIGGGAVMLAIFGSG